MKWRVREIERGRFVVERKGGLWWVHAVWVHGIWDSYPRRFTAAAEAIAAMNEAMAHWNFKTREIASAADDPSTPTTPNPVRGER